MKIRRKIVLLSTYTLAICLAHGQDSPSLGDLARQQREQKEQSKSDKNGKPAKVISNEEIPERRPVEIAIQNHSKSSEDTDEPRYIESGSKKPAEYWKSHILTQKNHVANLQREIDDLNESIRFAPANCVSNCVGWNERQREKQERVERMQVQLQELKGRLDEMQETARKQGYGTSVYDP